jgi:hypothetical protein
VKRTGRHEPVGVVIHICMETTQGNYLCSYLYFKLAKISCFSFYLLSFFFYKIGIQEGRIGSGVGGLAQWEGVGVGEMGRRMNMAQIMCTCVS